MAEVSQNMLGFVFTSLFLQRESYPLRGRHGSCIHFKRPVVAPRRLKFKAVLNRFAASDFEIRRIVGQQGYATITDWEYYGGKDPTAPTRTVQASEPAVRLYDATLITPTSQYRNSRVLLKEFLEGGAELAVNEAEAYKILYGSEGNRIDPDVIPVATLLGTFLADASFNSPEFQNSWKKQFPKSPIPPASGTPFLVFRWEGLQTGMNAAVVVEEIPGVRFLDKVFPSSLRQRKTEYVNALLKQALAALLYLHGTAGIVHRSLGLASLMVNTTEYRYASALQVKIRDLGFAKPVSSLVSGTDLEKARKAGAVSPSEIARYHFAEDIYALGYAFTEFIFAIFSERTTTQDTFKKLFEDTFELDIEQFRSYCAEDPEYRNAVEYLDAVDKAGWKFLQAMLKARQNFREVSLEGLARMPLLEK